MYNEGGFCKRIMRSCFYRTSEFGHHMKGDHHGNKKH